MTNVHGTNLTTVAPDAVFTGQITVGETSVSLSTVAGLRTGPLSHGIWFQTAGSTIYVNAGGAGNAVATTTGVLLKANNPLFIPVRDPSQINLIASAAGKVVTFITC